VRHSVHEPNAGGKGAESERRKARGRRALLGLLGGGGSAKPDVGLDLVVGVIVEVELPEVPLNLVLLLELVVSLQVADVV